MKFASIASAILLLCLASTAYAQSGAPRAWQQRVAVTIDPPVPIVALESANPFAIAVDQPPRLVTSTPPKKLDVQGEAVVLEAEVVLAGAQVFDPGFFTGLSCVSRVAR